MEIQQSAGRDDCVIFASRSYTEYRRSDGSVYQVNHKGRQRSDRNDRRLSPEDSR